MHLEKKTYTTTGHIRGLVMQIIHHFLHSSVFVCALRQTPKRQDHRTRHDICPKCLHDALAVLDPRTPSFTFLSLLCLVSSCRLHPIMTCIALAVVHILCPYSLPAFFTPYKPLHSFNWDMLYSLSNCAVYSVQCAVCRVLCMVCNAASTALCRCSTVLACRMQVERAGPL